MSITEVSNRNMSITQIQLSYISQNNQNNPNMSIEMEQTKKSSDFYGSYLNKNEQNQNHASSKNFSEVINQSHNQLTPNFINISNNNSHPDFRKGDNLIKLKNDFENLKKQYDNLQEKNIKLFVENQQLKNKIKKLEKKVNEYSGVYRPNRIKINSFLNPEEEKILNEDYQKKMEKENNKRKLISMLSSNIKEEKKDNLNKSPLDKNQKEIIEKELKDKKLKEMKKFAKKVFGKKNDE